VRPPSCGIAKLANLIHDGIVWQDRRIAPMCDKMRADGLESIVQEKTGLVIDAYFSGPKVAWMLQNDHGARQKAEVGGWR
jgi:glycerol kinase